MSKKNNKVETVQGTELPERDFNYWFNEYEYFMDAIEGLKMSHAILSQMAQHSKNKAQELNPDFKPEED